MPISQQRMIAVIDAGKDYQRALDTILRSIAGATDRAEGKSPEIVWEELYNLSLLANPLGLLHAPMKSPAILLAEDRHFKSSAGRNNYARKWQIERRQHLVASALMGKLPTRQLRDSVARVELRELPDFLSDRDPPPTDAELDAQAQDIEQVVDRLDPRVTPEDHARFKAQLAEDKKRDAAFGAHMFKGLKPEDEADCKAEAEREFQRQKHEARSAELARASKDGKGD